mmetsp:Transcript_102634/g.257258  ORF Transcript_102634/g.257258 Transcript_102634/m.257258 type:complete len:266 (-) Transcript_102634:388-1185(-)
MTTTLSPPSFVVIAAVPHFTKGWASDSFATAFEAKVSSVGRTFTTIRRGVALWTHTTPRCPPFAHPAMMTAARGGGEEPRRSSMGPRGMPEGCSTATCEFAVSPSSQSMPMWVVPSSRVPGRGSTIIVTIPRAVVSIFLRTPFLSKLWQLDCCAAQRSRWLWRRRRSCLSAAETRVWQASKSDRTVSRSSSFSPLASVASSWAALERPSGRASPTRRSKVSDQAWCCDTHCTSTPPPDSGIESFTLAMSPLMVRNSALQDLSSHM